MDNFGSDIEYKKFQTEWVLVNLVKELRGISNKGANPTYNNAIKLAMQIMPEIFNENSYIVKKHHEPELVRSYRQQAEAQSKIEGIEINPILLVDKRIHELYNLIATEIETKDLLYKELEKLQRIRPLFLQRCIKEDYILHHDVRCFKFGVDPISIKAKYSDYSVSEDRIIRVRMIHPNDGEQSMGADLIYEQYNPEKRKVRFIMVQYKIWDGELLYWSEAKI